MKAASWTSALERERTYHSYCHFVTLTYSDRDLPLMNLGNFTDSFDFARFKRENTKFVSNRLDDDICIPFHDFKMKFAKREEWSLFAGLYKQFGGIPYACYIDIQKFHKRLNKWFKEHVTSKYKNFRFFIVSEFGCTTLRPHFHGIYYIDDPRVSERFKEAISICWRLGIIDSQQVENSACSYVAQYINKFSDLPLFYKETQLHPKYWFSKNPIIGCQDYGDSKSALSDCTYDLQEIFDNCSVEVCCRRKATATDFVVLPLHKSIENRLFPKCPFYGSISDSLRTQLYNIAGRFAVEGYSDCFGVFRRKVISFLQSIYDNAISIYHFKSTEFSDFLNEMFYKPYMSEDEVVSNQAFGWLRRLYYLSRRILKNMEYFHVSLSTYVDKINEYYKKKELWLLQRFYSFQSGYDDLVEHLSLMYPEFVWNNGFTLDAFIDNIGFIRDVDVQKKDAAFYAESNKKTHFKNAYLDSLAFKRTYKTLFIHLKNYFYAQKCNETLEAFAA